MKRPDIILLIAAAGAALAGASCASAPAKPETVALEPFAAADEARGRDAAEAFAAGFVEAVRSGEFARWQPVLPDREKSRITPEVFSGMRKELREMLGELESGVYFGVLRKGDLRDHLWKLRFVREGNTQEVLFLVRVFRRAGSEPEISGFGIKRF